MGSQVAPQLTVTEIYKSIQGESTYAGLPCVFIRLTGCDLRCTYCDSEYAFFGGTKKEIPSILQEVEEYKTDLVEITGGEPLLQKNVHPLMIELLNRGKKVLIETSGAQDISLCDPRVIRIMDLKCPSSGEMKKNDYQNIPRLKPTDELKFVIGNRDDFDWSVQLIQKEKLIGKLPILFSAVYEKLPLPTLADWIKDSNLPIRLQPQLHKVLWGTRPSV